MAAARSAARPRRAAQLDDHRGRHEQGQRQHAEHAGTNPAVPDTPRRLQVLGGHVRIGERRAAAGANDERVDRRRRRVLLRRQHGDRCEQRRNREAGGRSLRRSRRHQALLGDDQAGAADDGAIAIDERLDANQARPEWIGLDEKRAGAARPGLGRSKTRPAQATGASLAS